MFFLIEKYLKTTVFGMTGHAPDYAMLMVKIDVFFSYIILYSIQVGANAGVIGMTKEHLVNTKNSSNDYFY
jgi:GTPase